MSTVSNNISNEIDAIIAQAMAEYERVKGVSVFNTDSPADSIEEEEPTHQEIPTNSRSILVEESSSRFSSAIWFDNIRKKKVLLAGLGGIGSYVAFLLARLRIDHLIILDPDVVEAGNMSGQLYGTPNIGEAKVYATITNLASLANYHSVSGAQERFTSETSTSDIMICGFDNMESRSLFFNKWLNHVASVAPEERRKCLFIDGRLAAETFQVFCVRGDDDYSINRYKEHLFDDSEAEETVCSYKQTTFMANMIASVMVNLFVNFCANECDPLIQRDLPFYTEYTAETMYFKVVA